MCGALQTHNRRILLIFFAKTPNPASFEFYAPTAAAWVL